MEFSARTFKKKDAEAKPVAHAAAATATPVATAALMSPSDLLTTSRGKALAALVSSCAVGTVQRANAASDFAAYLATNGVDEIASPDA